MNNPHSIRIEAHVAYLESESRPESKRYVFAYTITIRNGGEIPARLLARHWIITDANVDGDEKRAHSCVTPGKAAIRNPDGSFAHAPVWKYLFTHPTELTGSPSPTDPDCTKNHIPTP
jgi:ApaG protein